ncbi:MAG: sigma-70 family RNA polymerase sigma factor [Clostridia bacterium]|nr:sigma-70 family RNA polymerase sigma factor [Clostridia bacterium]
MDDTRIIDLYFKRSESAIIESNKKYGGYCGKIANNILGSFEDAEECVNDTWFRAWNAIPPKRPERLAVFFGRITRNLAIDRYRKKRSEKLGGGQIALCLDELEECIGETNPIADAIGISELLNGFLSDLPERTRNVFLFRYWYMMPVAEIAAQTGMNEGAIKMTLQRVRNKLKDYLKKEGVGI